MNEDPIHSCPNVPFSAGANGDVLILFVRLPDEVYTHKKWCKEERSGRLCSARVVSLLLYVGAVGAVGELVLIILKGSL